MRIQSKRKISNEDVSRRMEMRGAREEKSGKHNLFPNTGVL